MDLKIFFSSCRANIFKGSLSQSQVDGTIAILRAVDGLPISWVAYALATAWHETAKTMQPIKEYGSDDYFRRMYDPQGDRPQVASALGNTQVGDGVKYAGRGYVQCTGRGNAKRAGCALSLPIEDNPSLLLIPAVAAKVMRYGMEQGWFTGHGFVRYLPLNASASIAQFTAARRIINGQDCAEKIAEYARAFQSALIAACEPAQPKAPVNTLSMVTKEELKMTTEMKPINPPKSGFTTSEFALAAGTILSVIVAQFTGFEIDKEVLSQITSVVIAFIGGRSGVKAIVPVLASIFARK